MSKLYCVNEKNNRTSNSTSIRRSGNPERAKHQTFNLPSSASLSLIDRSCCTYTTMLYVSGVRNLAPLYTIAAETLHDQASIHGTENGSTGDWIPPRLEETGTTPVGGAWWADEAARRYCKLLLRFSRGQSEAVDSATSSRQTACIWTAISWEERRAAAAIGEAETTALVLAPLFWP